MLSFVEEVCPKTEARSCSLKCRPDLPASHNPCCQHPLPLCKTLTQLQKRSCSLPADGGLEKFSSQPCCWCQIPFCCAVVQLIFLRVNVEDGKIKPVSPQLQLGLVSHVPCWRGKPAGTPTAPNSSTDRGQNPSQNAAVQGTHCWKIQTAK